MRIVISSDKKGLELKNQVVAYLQERGFDVEDLTTAGDDNFYDASIKVVQEVLKDVSENMELAPLWLRINSNILFVQN